MYTAISSKATRQKDVGAGEEETITLYHTEWRNEKKQTLKLGDIEAHDGLTRGKQDILRSAGGIAAQARVGRQVYTETTIDM